ncbi:hypothetical protein [Flaviaesturariibacter amylovorans]|uniref:Uncharacterized protein n=1 Tax=Flaviaesturariibacter amylovorans TaxID=1084520 RepID=A0ABP8HU89_9BACT
MIDQLPSFAPMLAARRADGSEPTDVYTALAAELARGGTHAAKGRAAFIRDQCAGFGGKAVFAKYRDAWGFPKGDAVTLADFRRGFLYRFRDSGDAALRAWFLAAPEARAVRRYERWSSDAGFPQCVAVHEGSYEELEAVLRSGAA